MQTNNKRGHKNRPRWDFAHINPVEMRFRVVRFKLPNGEYETLATSLPRDIFSINDLKEIYAKRWCIEGAFKFSKYAIGLVNLHGKSDEFAMQEVYAGLTFFSFCSRIVSQVILEKKKENIYEYRVNMTMATQLCKQFFRTPEMSGKELLAQIGRYVVPVRPNRADERKIVAKGFAGFTYRIAA